MLKVKDLMNIKVCKVNIDTIKRDYKKLPDEDNREFIVFINNNDDIAGIMFALEFYSLKDWGWMLFNAILSIALAVVFLIGWPFSSVWLVGLFVGISLIFDGVAIITVGYNINKNF